MAVSVRNSRLTHQQKCKNCPDSPIQISHPPHCLCSLGMQHVQRKASKPLSLHMLFQHICHQSLRHLHLLLLAALTSMRCNNACLHSTTSMNDHDLCLQPKSRKRRSGCAVISACTHLFLHGTSITVFLPSALLHGTKGDQHSFQAQKISKVR